MWDQPFGGVNATLYSAKARSSAPAETIPNQINSAAGIVHRNATDKKECGRMERVGDLAVMILEP